MSINRDFCRDNDFIKFIMEIWDWIYLGFAESDIRQVLSYSDRSFIFNKKRKRANIDDVLENCFEEKVKHNCLVNYEDLLLNKIYPEMISFNTLWNFSQFIRFSEKCLFYNNNQSKPLFVDSDLYSEKEHRMYIPSEEFDIYVKLTKIKDDVLDREICSVNIKIIHKDGKKMTNEFIIVNDLPKLDDDSNVILLCNIKTILKDIFITTLEEIVNNLKEKYIKVIKRSIK